MKNTLITYKKQVLSNPNYFLTEDTNFLKGLVNENDKEIITSRYNDIMIFDKYILCHIMKQDKLICHVYDIITLKFIKELELNPFDLFRDETKIPDEELEKLIS
jgi:hypothetical protein